MTQKASILYRNKSTRAASASSAVGISTTEALYTDMGHISYQRDRAGGHTPKEKLDDGDLIDLWQVFPGQDDDQEGGHEHSQCSQQGAGKPPTT